jgi:glutaredoxin-related protein
MRAPSPCAVPAQVFVKGEFVGGADVLMEMHKAGELQQLAAELVGGSK